MSAPVPHPLTVLLNAVAAQGKGGDRLLGHMTPGDVVVPAEKRTPKVNAALEAILGKQLPRFTAGNTANLFNPQTGLPEFDAEGGGEGPGAEGGGNGNGNGPGSGAADSGNGTGNSGTQGGNSTNGGANGMGVGGGNASGGANSGANQGVSGGDGTPSGAPGEDQVGATQGLTAAQGLGIPPSIVDIIGVAGKMPGIIGAIGKGLSAVNNMSAHGVDQASNPGGNLSSGQTGGVGMGKGAGTDPGAGGPGAGGSAGWSASDALASLYGLPYWQYRPFG